MYADCNNTKQHAESQITSNDKNKKSSEDVQKKYDGDEVSELVQWIDNQICDIIYLDSKTSEFFRVASTDIPTCSCL